MRNLDTTMVRKFRKLSVKIRGRLGLFDRFHFLIIGSAKCGTTSLHNYLRAHPEIYMPSLSTGVGGETGFFLNASDEAIKELSNVDIRTDPNDILSTYNGESLIGERSTDYTKRPYRSVRMDEIPPDTKIIFLYRDPIERIQKMYNHHLKHRPEKTSQHFRDEDVEYYVRTSMYDYQIRPWLEACESFFAANIRVDDRRLFPAVTDFLGLSSARETPPERKNVNRSEKIEVDLTNNEKSRLNKDYDRFRKRMESKRVVHITKQNE